MSMPGSLHFPIPRSVLALAGVAGVATFGGQRFEFNCMQQLNSNSLPTAAHIHHPICARLFDCIFRFRASSLGRKSPDETVTDQIAYGIEQLHNALEYFHPNAGLFFIDHSCCGSLLSCFLAISFPRWHLPCSSLPLIPLSSHAMLCCQRSRASRCPDCWRSPGRASSHRC